MKYLTPLIAVSLATVCRGALAAEYGDVISSTPVVAQVVVPQQECGDVTQAVKPPTSGAGAAVGALVGGVVGNAIGGGVGRLAITGLGAVAGAVVGDRAEAANSPTVDATVRHCQAMNNVENRVVGYDVTYAYRGQRYTARFAQDPGARVALNVSVSPAGETVTPAIAYAAATTVLSPTYVPVAGFGPYGPYDYYDDFGAPGVAVYPRFGIGVRGHFGRRW